MVDAALDVAAELVELVERGQERDHDQAALATGEAEAGPDVAEAEVDDEGAERAKPSLHPRGRGVGVDVAAAQGREDVLALLATLGLCFVRHDPSLSSMRAKAARAARMPSTPRGKPP